MARKERTGEDLRLLRAAVELAAITGNVPIARAFRALHGRMPGPKDMHRLRKALGRLEADGLLQCASSLDVTPTPDGRVAAELLRFRGAKAQLAG